MIRLLSFVILFFSTAACASDPKPLTAAEKEAAMANCFAEFEVQPILRERCITRVRTAPDAE